MKGRVEDQNRARELRAEGFTVNKICAMVKASKGSVSPWIRDVIISDAGKLRLAKHHAGVRNPHRRRSTQITVDMPLC